MILQQSIIVNQYTTHHDCIDTNLRPLGIRGFLNLVISLVSESNAEESHFITISGGHIRKCFDQGLPFLNHRAQFVPRNIDVNYNNYFNTQYQYNLPQIF